MLDSCQCRNSCLILLHASDIFYGLLQAGLNLFVEKPLSLKPAAEVAELAGKLSELQSQQGLVIAVGYMLRAAPAIEVLCHCVKLLLLFDI